MKRTLACILLASSTVAAQSSDSSLARAAFHDAAPLQVSSSAFAASAAMPHPYSAYGENFSPALAWQGAPAATQAFVLLLEDPDAKAPAPSPYVHWVFYDLPATQNALHESIPAIPRLPDMGNAQQGRNSRGTIGYVGPRPPAGDAAHHYHFQIFALNAKLGLPPGATAAQVKTAMGGHVLASGEVVGTFAPPQ